VGLGAVRHGQTYRPTRGGEASTSSPGPSYCFGHFCLDTNDGLLLSDGRALSIRPKTLALLALFVTNPGRVLTHDAIVEAVWPGIVVTDESIAQCVRDLRRVLKEIKTELACSRDLLLAPCAADDHGEAERIEPARLAREGARYLLEGSFHRGAGVFRMTLRIIDLALNIYVWGKQYDRKSRRLFPVETELGCTAARDVEYAVAAAEQRHVIRRNVDQLGAWALFRRGLWHLGNSSRFDNDRAGDCFRRAIAVDPCFTLGHAGLALVHFNEGAVYLTRSTAESMELARSLVGAALRLDPDNAGARINGGIIAVGAGRLDDAWEQVEEALPAGSERPWAWGVQGTIEQWDGKPRQGRANLLNALRASPRDPQNAVLMGQVVISHYAEGDYAGTVKQALRTLARYPDCPLPWGWLTAAYGQLGDKDLARQALYETTLRAPHSLRQRAKGPNPWMRPSDYSHTVDGLEKAGWRRRNWET
jgi:tetratricopeptide (TPR) repeat protein